MLRPDGSLGRVLHSEVIGLVSELSKSDARKLLEPRLRPLNEGRRLPQSTTTFAAFVTEQFETTSLPTLKFGTQQSYSIVLRKHLLPRFGESRLCDISRVEIQRFLLEKLKQGYSWEHANKCRNLLSKVLGTAVSWGYLSDNPARGVKMPERTSKRPPTFLSAEEVRCLLTMLDEPARTIALLAIFTGLRIAEILGLRWGRLNLEGSTLRVEEICYKGRFGSPKTRASRREVPLPPTAVQALKEHRARTFDTSPDALVFSTRNGTPLSADNLRKRQLRSACQLAKLKPFGWHALRHTHSTLLHSLGTPLRVVQALLGHSRSTTTLEIYTHAPTDDQRAAVVKLEGILFPNVPKLHQDAATEVEGAAVIQ